MDILINHCWCSDSNRVGCYDCRVIVTLKSIPDGKTYYDKKCPDWALIETHPFKSSSKLSFRDETNRPRADVIAWLDANVKDRKLSKWQKENHSSPKGWAIGTDEYNATSTLDFHFFFEREKDGMTFIKRWSVYAKPTYYCQYFKDIRKKLNYQTGRMVDDSK